MKRNKQTASLYSLTEFAYLLLFVFIGAAVIMFVQIRQDRQTIAGLKQETEFLQKMLDEKKDGAVPCWKRPDSPVPEIAGTVVIHSTFLYTVQHHKKGEREVMITDSGKAEEQLKEVLRQVFWEDTAYAGKKKCYVRVKIVNETNDYSLYKNLASVFKSLGIVVVNS